ncbi:MAG: hypothetical protein VYD19_00910 [Myxococcota bacterium]|nr:hypothetical protein [Myxococcota bacterium]
MTKKSPYKNLSAYLISLVAVMLLTALLRNRRELSERESLLISLEQWAQRSEFFSETDEVAVRLLEEENLHPYRLRVYQLIPCQKLCEPEEDCEALCQRRGQEVSDPPAGSLLLFEVFEGKRGPLARIPFPKAARLFYHSWPPREFIVLRSQPSNGEHRFHFLNPRNDYQLFGEIDTGRFDEIRFEDQDGDGQPELIAPDPTFARLPHLYHIEVAFQISPEELTPAPSLTRMEPPALSQIREWIREAKEARDPMNQLFLRALTLAHRGYPLAADKLISFAYPNQNDYVEEQWMLLKEKLKASPFRDRQSDD